MKNISTALLALGLAITTFLPTGTYAILDVDSGALTQDSIYFIENDDDCPAPGTSASAGSARTLDLSYQDPARGNRATPVTVYLPSDGLPHPLLVFAPGRSQNSKTDGMYSRYLKAVTAEGFVVAGMDFIDNTSAASWTDDAKDISFAIDKLLGEAQLTGKIAGTDVGVFGHSDGGAIVMHVGYGDAQNTHVKAVISASGATGGSQNGPPLLVFHGTSDTTNPNGAQGVYGSVNPPYKAFVKFTGATHTSYLVGGEAGSDQTNPAADALTGAFFQRFLEGAGGDATDLKKLTDTTYKPITTFEESGSNAPTGSPAGGSAPAAANSAGCCPTNAATVLSGSDTEAQIWNYFAGKQLSPPQIAGIMGNIQAESDFVYLSKESGGTSPNPADADPLGWGLIQWTPGHKATDNAKAAGIDHIEILANQLDLIWSILQNKPVVTQPFDLAKFKTMTTVKEAGAYWETQIEGSVRDAGTGIHIQYGDAILAKYGSGAPASGSGGGSSSASGAAACGAGGSSISTEGWAFPMQTTKAVIKKGSANGSSMAVWCLDSQSNCHHDYNAADIFAPTGTTEVSVTDGKIIFTHDHDLAILSSNAKSQTQYVFWYGHMLGGSIKVKAGDVVKAGQAVGQTGTVADADGTNPHLHLDAEPAPPATTRMGCKDAACTGPGFNFINVQPMLVAAYQGLPD